MKAEIKGNELILTLPLQSPTLSKSGKTLIVAGTGGFVATTAAVDGKPVRVSVNAIVGA